MTTVPAPHRRPVGWLIAIGALGLALLLTLALLVGLAGTRTAAGRAAYVPAATKAARTATLVFLNVSADHVDADLKRMLDLSTGKFRAQYQARRTQLRSGIVQNHVQQTGKVLGVAPTQAGSTAATVLVAADATVRNTSTPKGRTVHYRIRLSLVRPHDRWLVSALSIE
ncbi:hypothetical protein AB0I55_16390 [Actinocatenispora sera]|uniref:hypothetical protein n=1 Tax=Actinocatenispora sera TaxID=390989 RepID=UPI00340CCE01